WAPGDRPERFSRTSPSQLPAVCRRANRLAGRHMDAKGSRIVAGLPVDALRASARHRVVLHPASSFCFGTARRFGIGQVFSTQAGSFDTIPFDAPGLDVGGAYAVWPHSSVAGAGARDLARND